MVDVAVVDSHGRPVSGLGAGRFRREGGRQAAPRGVGRLRRHSAARARHAGGPAASTRSGQRRTRLFSTNDSSSPAPAVGRLILIVVDELHIVMGGGKAVLAAAGRFLDRLTPADRVGLAVLPVGSPSVEFTVNRAVVREALGRVVGASAQSGSNRTTSR